MVRNKIYEMNVWYYNKTYQNGNCLNFNFGENLKIVLSFTNYTNYFIARYMEVFKSFIQKFNALIAFSRICVTEHKGKLTYLYTFIKINLKATK